LAPQAKVVEDDRIRGVNSGIDRQIDVSVSSRIGQFDMLVIIDCKDWKNPVDLPQVEQFSAVVKDVRASKGAMVCNAGFSKTAKEYASRKGIDLFSAVDAKSVQWPKYIALPTLCVFFSPKAYSFRFSHSAPTPFMMPAVDPRLLMLYRQDGEKADLVTNLLFSAWNEKKLPLKEGTHKDITFIEDDVYTKVDGVLYGPVEVSASVVVEKKQYYGAWPLDDATGFRNEITGAFATNSITTKQLNMFEVEKTWKHVENEQELAVSPVIKLVAQDFLPLTKADS